MSKKYLVVVVVLLVSGYFFIQTNNSQQSQKLQAKENRLSNEGKILGGAITFPLQSTLEQKMLEEKDNYPANIIQIAAYDDIRGEAIDIIIEKDLALLKCTDGLQIINISNPMVPNPLGRVDFLREEIGTTVRYGVDVQNDYLIADTTIVNIANPRIPKTISKLTIDSAISAPVELEIKDNFVYSLGSYDYSFEIIDIRNVLYPILVNKYRPDTSLLRSFEIKGDIAYLLSTYEGLVLVNVSNPYYIHEIARFPMTGLFLDITINGNYAFVSTSTGVTILDITTPTAISQIGHHDTDKVYRTTVNDTYAFLAKKENGLEIINIANPVNPVSIVNFTNLLSVESSAIKNNLVYLAAETEGMVVVNVSEITTPTISSRYNSYKSGELIDVAVINDVTYAANQSGGIVVFNSSNPYQLEQVNVVFPEEKITGISLNKSTELLYFTAEGEGVIITNISDNYLAPTIIGNYSLSSSDVVNDFVVYNDLALLACEESGLVVVDISNPMSPNYLSQVFNGEEVLKVDLKENYAFVVRSSNLGVTIIDITLPASPVVGNTFAESNHIFNFALGESKLIYLLAEPINFIIYDYTNPSAPELLSNLEIEVIGLEINLYENSALILSSQYVIVIDITDPENTAIQAEWRRGKELQSAWIEEELIFIACGYNGLTILSWDDDKDTLSNYEEAIRGTNEQNDDTDNDDINDGYEIFYSLNPLIDDSLNDPDSDGLTNLNEFQTTYVKDRIYRSYIFRLNPLSNDTDRDGLLDYDEINVYFSNALLADTDEDKLDDWEEVFRSTNLTNPDTDGDGLSDGDEVYLYGTNPLLVDTDGDGMPDDYEVDNNLNPVVNDANDDADSDGLVNGDEFLLGTDPNNPDTDEDGFTDKEEIDMGFDPLDPKSNPRTHRNRILAIVFSSIGALAIIIISGYFLSRVVKKLPRLKHEV